MFQGGGSCFPVACCANWISVAFCNHFVSFLFTHNVHVLILARSLIDRATAQTHNQSSVMRGFRWHKLKKEETGGWIQEHRHKHLDSSDWIFHLPAGVPFITALKVPLPTFSMGSWSLSPVLCPCPRHCPRCHLSRCPATRPRPPLSRPWPWKRRAQWKRRKLQSRGWWPASPTSWHAIKAT